MSNIWDLQFIFKVGRRYYLRPFEQQTHNESDQKDSNILNKTGRFWSSVFNGVSSSFNNVAEKMLEYIGPGYVDIPSHFPFDKIPNLNKLQ
ncbi:MAG: hypothetical protein EZS28_052788, partial [Streblomastix strix]